MVQLYDALLALFGSPVVAINRTPEGPKRSYGASAGFEAFARGSR